MKRLNREEFIISALLIPEHQNKEYNYDKFIYLGSKTKGIIICPKHGEFSQIPYDHLRGRGCRKCGNEKIGKLKSKSIFQHDLQQNFIAEYKSIKEASKITNINRVQISFNALNKKNKHVGGFIWSYTKLEPLLESIKIRKPTGFYKDKKYHDEAIQYAKESALKCKTRGEFYYRFTLAHKLVHKYDIIDEICSHMENKRILHKRLIYAIIFEDNHVYIGLTYNFKRRIKSHLSEKRKGDHNTVYNHIQKTGLTPKCIKLTELIDEKLAQIQEGDYLNKYKNEGYIILNKSKTGNLGGCKFTYSEEHLIEIAKKYKTRSEWQKKEPHTYQSARKRGKVFLDKCCEHMVQLCKPDGFWKDFENIKNELLPIIEELGHFPIEAELISLNKHYLLGGCKWHISLLNVREKMGYELKSKPHFYWRDFKNIENGLLPVIEKLGHFPTYVELRHLKREDLLNAIRKYYNIIELKQKMGY